MLNVKDTANKFKHGQQTVGTDIVQIMNSGYKFTKGIIFRAPGATDPVANTDPVWIGGADVSTATGMPVVPGETLRLPLDSGDNIYAISVNAAQLIAWVGA